MTPLGHIAGSYIALRFTHIINPSLDPNNSWILAAGIGAALLPDIDAFFYKKLRDHHDSPLHTPLFWVAIFAVLAFVAHFLNPFIQIFILALFIGIFTHLFLDWHAGRVAGMRLFYPFSKKRYSLVPLVPAQGKVSLKAAFGKDYLKFYAKNKFLFTSELIICLVAILLFIFY